MIRRIIVAGGGTGGHLFPGIAVIEELRRRLPGVEVLFVGTERGIEHRLLPKMGEQLALLDVAPLKGRDTKELLRNVIKLPRAGAQALGIVRRFRPDVVVGVGGYASGPMVAAASMLHVPTALLEQNARVGLTNRMLAPMVGRAYLTFPETSQSFAPHRVRVCGNPVRRGFVEAGRRAMTDPEGFEARADTLLVLGGSQGARSINTFVPEALGLVDVRARGFRVVHQAGLANQESIEARYRELGVPARVVPFIDDMAQAYSNAAMVIARAGATTLAELCAIGRPSILIPFPHAADDHQRTNAEALEARGASICLPETELSAESLRERVVAVLDRPEHRRAMADAARNAGRPEAAAAIVDDLFRWLHRGEDSGSEERRASETQDPNIEPNNLFASTSLGGAELSPALRGGRSYRPPRNACRPLAQRRPLVVNGALFEI